MLCLLLPFLRDHPNRHPRTILIDSQGKIAYDALGSIAGELRAEIAKLGPDYEFLLPKPKQAPCVAPT